MNIWLQESGCGLIDVFLGDTALGVITLTTDCSGNRNYESTVAGTSLGTFGRQCDAIAAIKAATF